MRARGIGVRDKDPSVGSARKKEVSAGKPAGQPKKQAKRNDDDIEDLDDIEAILKRHGI